MYLSENFYYRLWNDMLIPECRVYLQSASLLESVVVA